MPRSKKKNLNRESLPSTSSETATDFLDSTPNKKHACASNKSPCAFYKVTEDKDGKPVFSKALIKYFLTVDSPEMEDLKNKRFNTSFLHETPKPDRVIQIYTPEEDKDPKWLENVPKFEIDNMPEVPGSKHAHVFTSLPINDSDEELKKYFQENTPIVPKAKGRKRRSTHVPGYNGIPLPDESLVVDYTGILNSDTSFEDSSDDDLSTLKDIKIGKGVHPSDNESSSSHSSILMRALSAPTDKPFRPYNYGRYTPYRNIDPSVRHEDERLLQKYKDVMGNRRLIVVLPKLPLDAELLQQCETKNTPVKLEKKSKKRKHVALKKVSRIGLSRIQKKKTRS